MVLNLRGLRDEGGTAVFSNDYRYGFACTFDDIEDTALKQEADQWYSDYVKLLEYSKNTEYGKSKYFRCLLFSYAVYYKVITIDMERNPLDIHLHLQCSLPNDVKKAIDNMLCKEHPTNLEPDHLHIIHSPFCGLHMNHVTDFNKTGKYDPTCFNNEFRIAP